MTFAKWFLQDRSVILVGQLLMEFGLSTVSFVARLLRCGIGAEEANDFIPVKIAGHVPQDALNVSCDLGLVNRLSDAVIFVVEQVSALVRLHVFRCELRFRLEKTKPEYLL